MANNRMDQKTLLDLGRLIVFLIVTFLATMLLGILLSAGSFEQRQEYKAVFEDVTGVANGDEVRIAGVPVGQVRRVEIHDTDRALVTFTVSSNITLTDSTNVEIRFRNLVGQRYLVITEGDQGSGLAIDPGDTIPMSNTKGALDLNYLLAGFEPLFEALTPEDVNQLAFEIIQVLQGESGNIQSLLGTTASLTSTLADRDDLIGEVIDNLSVVLDTVGRNDEELDQTLSTLQQFVTGLKDDREALLGGLDAISELTVTTADLLTDIREPLAEDIRQLHRLTDLLTQPQNFGELEEVLQIVPIKWTKLANTATYGSFYNFYLCELHLNVNLNDILPGAEFTVGLPDVGIPMPAERCSL